MRLIHNSRLLTVASAVLLAGGAVAQTTTPTTSTTTTPCPSSTNPVLNSFTLERTLAPNQISSTFTPTFPQGLLTAVNAQTLEIRESFSYNSANQLITVNTFPVQTGAAIPTPFNNLTQGGNTAFAPNAIFGTLAIKVDRTYVSCTPAPSVMFVGTVATNTPASPFGDVTGAPVAVSIGLTSPTTGTPGGGTGGGTGGSTNPTINNVAVLLAGRALEYSAGGTGNVTFTTSSVTPPGTTGGFAITVTPVAAGTLKVVNLVATSTAANATYQWTVVAGAADVANQNSASALGYILGGAGSYTFRVTVKDPSGNTLGTQDLVVQIL